MEELREGLDAACAVAGQSYVGCIVRSVAGRDAKRLFAVVAAEEDSGADGGYVWLADGRLRRLEQPKRKKIRHFRVLCLPDEALAAKIQAGELTNRALHAYLTKFECMTQDNA